MSKKKKILLAVAAVACVAVCLCAFFGISHWMKNRIRYSVADTLPDGAGQRARVIILAGQSNASGCSLDEYLQENVTEEKYAEYQNGYENVYINYLSGMNTSGGFVKCATLQGEIEGGFGPELGMAEKLCELYPDETFYIIKCAWGGTNLFSEWLSPSSAGRTGKLYRHFIAYVQASIEYLLSKGYDVEIEGICWMQGESDSFSVEASENYGEHLTNFLADVRRRFSRQADADGIAFVDAYIAPNPIFWVFYEGVNRGKDEVAASSPLNVLVDTIANGLDCTQEPKDKPDIPHYDSLSEIKLGHLFIEQLVPFLD